MTTTFRYAGTDLAVRLPPVGDVLSLWMRPHLKDARIVEILRTAEVRRLVVDCDGTGIDQALAREIVAAPAAYQAYQEARHDELATATEGGAIGVECPHCLSWRAEVAPLAVAVLLRSAFRPLVDPWGDPALPAAADSGWRAAPAQAGKRLWLTLPGRPGETLPYYCDGAERARLKRWQAWSGVFFAASAGSGAAEDLQQDWSPDSPGWVALIRLVSMVPGLLGHDDPQLDPDLDADLEAVIARVLAATRIPLADVLFADNASWLTRLAPIPADAGGPIRCHACGGEFLPLAASPDWS